MAAEADTAVLVGAIHARRRVRLAYRRQADGVTTIHEVAPLDIRPGETAKTARTLYLWAWCFAEGQPEMHLMDRVEKVVELEDDFDPRELLDAWPKKWRLTGEWVVPRDWP